MALQVLTNEYLENLMYGACFLGCGGGGSLDMAKNVLETLKDLNKENKIQMIDIDDLDDDGYLCFIAGVGAPSAKINSPFLLSPLHSYENLIKETDQTIKNNFKYVIPGETGAMNSLLPLLVCAQSNNNIKLVNADGAGRALPQLKMCTFALSNIKCQPAVIANESGKKIILESELPEYLDKEIRDKMQNDSDFSGAAILASFVMRGLDLKKNENLCVKSSIKTTQALGKSLRISDAEERKKEILKIFKNLERYVVVFPEASIKNFTSKQQNGFDVGQMTLFKRNWSKDMECTIDFVNENLVVTFKKAGYIYPLWAPFMLCCIDRNGKPLSNADIPHELSKNPELAITFMAITPDNSIHNDKEKDYFMGLHGKFFINPPGDNTDLELLERILLDFSGIEFYKPNKEA